MKGKLKINKCFQKIYKDIGKYSGNVFMQKHNKGCVCVCVHYIHRYMSESMHLYVHRIKVGTK